MNIGFSGFSAVFPEWILVILEKYLDACECHCLCWWQWSTMCFRLSYITEGATKKASNFIMPLKSIYNKNFYFIEDKCILEHCRKVEAIKKLFLYFSFENCSVYHFRGALCELIFAIHKNVLRNWKKMHPDSNGLIILKIVYVLKQNDANISIFRFSSNVSFRIWLPNLILYESDRCRWCHKYNTKIYALRPQYPLFIIRI